MEKQVQVSLYVPEEMAEAINEIRHKERRKSKNNTYVYLLERALTNYKTLNN